MSSEGKNYHTVDIRGRQFRDLTALYPLPQRKKGFVMWRCRCRCGREVDYSYNELMYSHVQSCGCRKKEHSETLHTHLTHVAGTSMDILKSDKVPSNNTTGVKGVYKIRGKWVPKIVFQKKAYYLGTYDSFEDAAYARKQAEELICKGTVEYYRRWQQRADQDPQWAENNPIGIQVEKIRGDEIQVFFSPVLPEISTEYNV